MRMLAISSALILVVACFLPWVVIESKNLVLTGVDALNFRKPGYLHLLLAGLYLVFVLAGRSWSQKAAVFTAALNLAWATRNFVLISACSMGECPEKQFGIYLMLLASVVMLLAGLFSKVKNRRIDGTG